jgi:hypothetical protein
MSTFILLLLLSHVIRYDIEARLSFTSMKWARNKHKNLNASYSTAQPLIEIASMRKFPRKTDAAKIRIFFYPQTKFTRYIRKE